MLGTFAQRTARIGDGLIVFLTDVTDERRMEEELRSYADVVAHDLREPITGLAPPGGAARAAGRRAAAPDVLDLMRASTERARALIDGVLLYARAGELRRERVALGAVMDEVAEDLRPRLDAAGATLDVGALPEVDGDARPAAAAAAEPRRQRGEVPRRRRRASCCRRGATARTGW